ncbi:hypothetical protein FOZ61_006989 [Perkinsus olseni]|uniref:Uncharacterized protein n=1 Tax=Perkinsus olseni TaxID=32597 RepID=A0A7J6M9X6_PEROL|nr:hypothetical protein FOZ61_006989 [Perkinsus olseni]
MAFEVVGPAKKGAEKRWRCAFSGGCQKYRQNGTRFCVRHGGARACGFPGCTATSRKGDIAYVMVVGDAVPILAAIPRREEELVSAIDTRNAANRQMESIAVP